MRRAIAMLAAAFGLWLALTAGAAARTPVPQPTLDPQTVTVRKPDVAAIAAAGGAIVVAGGAGIWIYRVIRKGL